jgi:hypothetical protein
VKLYNFSRFQESLAKESDDPVSGGNSNEEITTMAEHILQNERYRRFKKLKELNISS